MNLDEVRVQQIAFGCVLDPGYAHRLSEGALPERVHGCSVVQLYGQYRPLDPLYLQLQSQRHARAAAGYQLVERRVHAG